MNTGAHLVPQALAALELFDGLSPAALGDVMANARVRHLAKDTRIFDQGDPGVRAHALIDGGVRISQSGSDGAQIVMRFIGPGEMFGTVALFTDGRYPADAVAFTDSLEASWSEAELFELMAAIPRSRSMSSGSSANVSRRCKTGSARFPPSALNSASPMLCCGSLGRPDTARSMGRRSSFHYGAGTSPTCPGPRSTPRAVS